MRIAAFDRVSFFSVFVFLLRFDVAHGRQPSFRSLHLREESARLVCLALLLLAQALLLGQRTALLGLFTILLRHRDLLLLHCGQRSGLDFDARSSQHCGDQVAASF